MESLHFIPVMLKAQQWGVRRYNRWYKDILGGLFIGCADYGLLQCFPTFSTSRYPWPRSSYLTVPHEEKNLFFKLIYFLIISYERDKVVYCCWVSIYTLINDVILFIIFFISKPRGTPRKRLWYPGYCGTPVGNHWSIVMKSLSIRISQYQHLGQRNSTVCMI
jgi:hypothetical protein